MQIGGIMQKKGFTLVEVLAVVLIVAILTAVALPQYRNIKERAEIQGVIVRLRMILDASERLAAINGYKNFPAFASVKQTEYETKYGKNYPFFQKMAIFDDKEFSGCNLGNSTTGLFCGKYNFSVAPLNGAYRYVEMYTNNWLSIKLYRSDPPKLTCGTYGHLDVETTSEIRKKCENYGIEVQ